MLLIVLITIFKSFDNSFLLTDVCHVHDQYHPNKIIISEKILFSP